MKLRIIPQEQQFLEENIIKLKEFKKYVKLNKKTFGTVDQNN